MQLQSTPPRGDCEALPMGAREALLTGARQRINRDLVELIQTWRLSVGETGNQFPVSKLKSVLTD
jgi:hypothetical protein